MIEKESCSKKNVCGDGWRMEIKQSELFVSHVLVAQKGGGSRLVPRSSDPESTSFRCRSYFEVFSQVVVEQVREVYMWW